MTICLEFLSVMAELELLTVDITDAVAWYHKSDARNPATWAERNACHHSTCELQKLLKQ